MATIRRTKNKTWLAEVRKFGQYKAKTFDTKLKAQAWAVEVEQTMTPDTLVLGKSLKDAFLRYQKEVSPTKKSWKNEHNRLNKFSRNKMANLILEDIRQTDIYEWIDEELKRIKGSSVNRDLNLLSSVFEKSIRWSWTNNNPVRGIERPKNPQPRDRRISEYEITRILDALAFNGSEITEQRHEIAVALLFAIETAMRQSEIWGLACAFINLNRKFLRLNETKNGTRRDVPLSVEAIRLMKLLKPKKTGRVFISNQNSSATIFGRAVKLAGIVDLTFHDSRHEGITRLSRKLDILDLARMVGHRDPRSLMIYYNATAEEIANRLD